jgi:hypothetical protein
LLRTGLAGWALAVQLREPHPGKVGEFADRMNFRSAAATRALRHLAIVHDLIVRALPGARKA